MKKWPFPGDQPVIRARKMALAYRNLCEQQENAMRQVREVIAKMDRRLIAFDNPASIELLNRALKELDNVTTTGELDARFTDWGEGWHAERPVHYEMDEYVKPTVAASILHISSKTISNLRTAGRLKGKWDPDLGTVGGYSYKVSDLHDLSAKLRGRGWRGKGSTDTLNDSGRSDTE